MNIYNKNKLDALISEGSLKSQKVKYNTNENNSQEEEILVEPCRIM